MRPRVLVVDDDADIRKMLHSALCEVCDVVEAENGHRGVSEVMIGDPPIDLVVTDLKMPGGNGVELAESLPKHMPVIILSGYLHTAEFQDKLQCLHPVAMFRKPVDLSVLREAILKQFRTEEVRGRVLIMDDDTSVRLPLRKVLEQAGFVVDEAANGADGIALYVQEPYDLVIVDIFMPIKSGLEVIQELRQRDRGVKLVAVSGVDIRDGLDLDTLARIYNLERAFEKPFELKDMLDAVQELLNKNK